MLCQHFQAVNPPYAKELRAVTWQRGVPDIVKFPPLETNTTVLPDGVLSITIKDSSLSPRVFPVVRCCAIVSLLSYGM